MDQDVWTHTVMLNEDVPVIKRKQLLIKWILTGYSKSALRTGFKMGPFHLDAGHSIFGRWHICLISHGHADHIFSFASFFLVNCDHIPTVLAPNTNLVKAIADSTLRSNYDTDKFHVKANFIDAIPGDVHDVLLNQDKYRVAVIKMDHTVPTVGYCVSKQTMKLDPKLVALKNSLESRDFATLIKKLKAPTHNDPDIADLPTLDKVTVEHWVPQFCFLTDTSINGIVNNIDTIKEYPIILVECTFYDKSDIEHSYQKKHIHWVQIEPFIRLYPDSLWVLIHSSTRYKARGDIMEAIKTNENYTIHKNCIIWI